MQQDKSDIENKLRKLENQQLPDLSKMDEHWQAMLIQGNGLSKIAANKNWLWAAAAIFVIFTAIFLSNLNGNIENELPAAQPGIVSPKIPIDTIPDPKIVASGLQYLPRQTKAPESLLISTNDSVVNITMVPAFNDTSNTSFDPGLKKEENNPGLSYEQTQMMLGDLLRKLQKKAELFTINNKRDTVIKAKEGTIIFIPSNSFKTDDAIVFEVREFYKYSDMVANGLTTLSGARQLITGGMIYLSAKVKGNEISINPTKEIRAFIPGITSADSMQVFEGVKIETIDKANASVSERINWELTKIRIDSPVSRMFIRAIDLRDDLLSYGLTLNGKTKAVFRMSRNSLYSKDELKAVLKKKHGDYYDKIIVKKPWKRNLLFKKVVDESDEEYGFVSNSWGVGDTAELLPGTVRIYKLTPIDTVYRIVKWITTGYKDVQRPVFPAMALSSIGEKYSIGLNKLGWINCDRFYNYEGRKSDFIVDLKDSAHNYITYLVFENFKSIMQGGGSGNYAVFPNVPLDQPVKVICIGIKDGKTVATVKSAITSVAVLKELSFELTSFAAISSSLEVLND